MALFDFENMMFWIGEYAKKVGRVAYQKVQDHVTMEMEHKADGLLDRWLPEDTPFVDIT